MKSFLISFICLILFSSSLLAQRDSNDREELWITHKSKKDKSFEIKAGDLVVCTEKADPLTRHKGIIKISNNLIIVDEKPIRLDQINRLTKIKPAHKLGNALLLVGFTLTIITGKSGALIDGQPGEELAFLTGFLMIPSGIVTKIVTKKSFSSTKWNFEIR